MSNSGTPRINNGTHPHRLRRNSRVALAGHVHDDHVKIGFWLSQTVGRNAGGGDNGKNAQKLFDIVPIGRVQLIATTTEKMELCRHIISEKCVKYILIISEKRVILFSDV